MKNRYFGFDFVSFELSCEIRHSGLPDGAQLRSSDQEDKSDRADDDAQREIISG